MSVLLPHVTHVGNGRAHPVVHGGFQMNQMFGRARLASPEVWQHPLAELLQLARLLGVHDGKGGSVGF